MFDNTNFTICKTSFNEIKFISKWIHQFLKKLSIEVQCTWKFWLISRSRMMCGSDNSDRGRCSASSLAAVLSFKKGLSNTQWNIICSSWNKVSRSKEMILISTAAIAMALLNLNPWSKVQNGHFHLFISAWAENQTANIICPLTPSLSILHFDTISINGPMKKPKL